MMSFKLERALVLVVGIILCATSIITILSDVGIVFTYITMVCKFLSGLGSVSFGFLLIWRSYKTLSPAFNLLDLGKFLLILVFTGMVVLGIITIISIGGASFTNTQTSTSLLSGLVCALSGLCFIWFWYKKFKGEDLDLIMASVSSTFFFIVFIVPAAVGIINILSLSGVTITFIVTSGVFLMCGIICLLVGLVLVLSWFIKVRVVLNSTLINFLTHARNNLHTLKTWSLSQILDISPNLFTATFSVLFNNYTHKVVYRLDLIQALALELVFIDLSLNPKFQDLFDNPENMYPTSIDYCLSIAMNSYGYKKIDKIKKEADLLAKKLLVKINKKVA